MKINRKKIDIYINETISKNISKIYREFELKGIREYILSRYVTDDFLIQDILNMIDDKKQELNEVLTPGIKAKQKTKIVDYIEEILSYDDGNHILKPYLKEAIEGYFVPRLGNMPGTDGNNKEQFGSHIITKIFFCFELLNINDKDHKLNLAKKRDYKKIRNATMLLSQYTNSPHIRRTLETISKNNYTPTKTEILSCVFYIIANTVNSYLNLPKKIIPNSEIEFLAKEIMQMVFNAKKDYRIYINTQNIRYKNFTLKKYTT